MTLSATPSGTPATSAPPMLSSPPRIATASALMSSSDSVQSTPCTDPQSTPAQAAPPCPASPQDRRDGAFDADANRPGGRLIVGDRAQHHAAPRV